MTHTPGPWAIGLETDENDGHGQIISPEGEHIASVSMYPIVANARLLAAAPELLEAAKGMLREFGNQQFNVRKDYSKMVYLEAARAAIARAEGRE